MATKVATTARERVRYEQKYDLLSPEYEVLDPNPDLHTLFAEYNTLFFDEKLAGCEVKWSNRMTLCAGLCSFQPRSGFCSIRLSEPLLKLRPRGDMINTLLHEMIHAYVFVFSPVKDHDDHGAVFQSHMHRINQVAGTKITVFHTFHDEVDSYRQHWWKCDGPCQRAPPYYGVVKRAMNRPPAPTDNWWEDHQRKCGGTYTKIKEPPEYTRKQEKKQNAKKKKAATPSVKSFFPTVDEGSAKADSEVEEKQSHVGTATPGDTHSSQGGSTKCKEPSGSTNTKLPKTKKPRREEKNPPVPSAAPRPPPPSQSSDVSGSFFGVPDASGFPVVISMGDDEFYLAGDIHAVFQIPPTPSGTRTVTNESKQVVDLTFSDDDDEGEMRLRPSPARDTTTAQAERRSLPTSSSVAAIDSQSRAGVPQSNEVIEID